MSVDVTKQLAGAVVGLNKDGARKLMLSSLVSFSRTSESEIESQGMSAKSVVRSCALVDLTCSRV